MGTLTKISATKQGTRRIALMAAAVIASTGLVVAKEHQATKQPAYANQYYGLYQGSRDADRAQFDRSGTRGREGLGEDPLHPEGPGNVAD
jgi:hypothetical protein